MTTVIQLDDADFSGLGFPNIYPYMKKENLTYAYDFRYGNFSDFVTGVEIKGWLSDTTANTTKSINPRQITEISGNELYVKLRKGAAFSTHKSKRNYTIGDKFTAMIVGGIPSQTNVSGKYLTFLEMGNNVSASGIPTIEANLSAYNNPQIGYRAKNDSALTSSSGFSLDKLNFMILIFDGVNFTLINKTTGFVDTKSLTSLGITNLTVPTAGSIIDQQFHSFGTISNILPELFASEFLLGQVAFWDNAAMTIAEADEQYAMMKAIYSDLI